MTDALMKPVLYTTLSVVAFVAPAPLPQVLLRPQVAWAVLNIVLLPPAGP